MRCPYCRMGEEVEDAVVYDGDGRPWHQICARTILSTWLNAREQMELRRREMPPLTILRVVKP